MHPDQTAKLQGQAAADDIRRCQHAILRVYFAASGVN
jgi:hypothetical protein